METSEQEKLQLEVIQALCTLPRDCLLDLCDFLTIAGPEFENISSKNGTWVISLMSSHLERQELKKLEDQGMAELLLLMDKISEYKNTTEPHY